MLSSINCISVLIRNHSRILPRNMTIIDCQPAGDNIAYRRFNYFTQSRVVSSPLPVHRQTKRSFCRQLNVSSQTTGDGIASRLAAFSMAVPTSISAMTTPSRIAGSYTSKSSDERCFGLLDCLCRFAARGKAMSFRNGGHEASGSRCSSIEC